MECRSRDWRAGAEMGYRNRDGVQEQRLGCRSRDWRAGAEMGYRNRDGVQEQRLGGMLLQKQTSR